MKMIILTRQVIAEIGIPLAFSLLFGFAGSWPVKAQDVPDLQGAEEAKSVVQNFLFRSVEMDNRIRIREATNSLRQTPEIAAILKRIATGTTDEEIRLARIDYYTALGRGLTKALPDLKERIREQTQSALARLQFQNVRSHEEIAR